MKSMETTKVMRTDWSSIRPRRFPGSVSPNDRTAAVQLRLEQMKTQARFLAGCGVLKPAPNLTEN